MGTDPSKAYRDAVERVSCTLHRRDPLSLGAGDDGLPSNEYAGEAAEIVRRLYRREMNAASVAEVIYEVFKDSFGTDDAGPARLYQEISSEVAAAVAGRAVRTHWR